MSEELNVLPEVTQNQILATTQGPNLIMFTPSPGHNTLPQQVPEKQMSKPKKKRSPRRRKTKSDWQLNQRQFKQNRSQISHILPQEPIVPEVFNMGEEPSVSYPSRSEWKKKITRM